VSNAVQNSTNGRFAAINEITQLEMALADMRRRLASAVNQGVHEDDRATLLSQVGLLLEKIAELKAKQRFRR
jgi:hypothetical protein